LVAFQAGITLGETQLINIYQGVLLYGGSLEVNFGYRKANGTVVLSPEMVGITIAD
jgi:hypothetical protein